MLVSTYESARCHNLDEHHHHHPHTWENSDVTWVKEFLFHVVTWIVYFWVTVGRARRPLSSIPSMRSLCTRGRHDVRHLSPLIKLSCLFIDLYEKLIIKLCWHYTTLSWVKEWQFHSDSKKSRYLCCSTALLFTKFWTPLDKGSDSIEALHTTRAFTWFSCRTFWCI
jgi:hypothetical protein